MGEVGSRSGTGEGALPAGETAPSPTAPKLFELRLGILSHEEEIKQDLFDRAKKMILSVMDLSDFMIGMTFWCGDRHWRCTDIGTRTVIAIRIDSVAVESTVPELCRTLNQSEAEAAGWFNGPPYAVAESVFDEDALDECSLEPNLAEVLIEEHQQQKAKNENH